MAGQVIISVATSRRRLDPRVRDAEYTVTVDSTSDIGAVVAKLRGLEAAVVAWIEREGPTAVGPEPAVVEEASTGPEVGASSPPASEVEEAPAGQPESPAGESPAGEESGDAAEQPIEPEPEPTTNTLRSSDVVQDSGRE